MTSSDPQYAKAIQLLEQRLGWARMTAYDRTKALMEALAHEGIDAPNWMAIRSLIGKGSSGDINRAKQDFRKELGVRLGRMRGTKGMPEEVADGCTKLWLSAVEQAAKTFDEQVNAFAVDLEQAESALMDAEAQRDDALSRMQALEGEKAELEANAQRMFARYRSDNESLQVLVDTERAAKEQAQHMFEAVRAELAGQLEQTQSTLVRSQQETAAALTRFEGLENRFQQEIDRTRQELADERKRMNTLREQDQATHEIERERGRTQLGVERSKRQEVDRRLATAQAEVAELRTQLAAAQAMIQTALQNGQIKTIRKSKATSSQDTRKGTSTPSVKRKGKP
jgi:septal ring factor EnvC (AmiA/AmiB activator)